MEVFQLTQTPEIADLEARIEASEDAFRTNPASSLIKFIKRTGAFAGEIVDFTPAQYRDLTGKSPNPSIINKAGRVPWELALDVVASQLGFRDDEDLKIEIERMDRLKGEIDELKRRRRELVEAIPKCEPITNAFSPCQEFPERECRIKTVNCGENFAVAIRHPIQWSIHSDFPPTPENEIQRVGRAAEANKIIRDQGRFPGGFESAETVNGLAARCNGNKQLCGSWHGYSRMEN